MHASRRRREPFARPVHLSASVVLRSAGRTAAHRGRVHQRTAGRAAEARAGARAGRRSPRSRGRCDLAPRRAEPRRASRRACRRHGRGARDLGRDGACRLDARGAAVRRGPPGRASSRCADVEPANAPMSALTSACSDVRARAIVLRGRARHSRSRVDGDSGHARRASRSPSRPRPRSRTRATDVPLGTAATWSVLRDDADARRRSIERAVRLGHARERDEDGGAAARARRVRASTTPTRSSTGRTRARQARSRGHTLVWHQQVPDWLGEEEWAAAELEQVLRRARPHRRRRYRGRVATWDVVNEPFTDRGRWRSDDGFPFARRARPASTSRSRCAPRGGRPGRRS